MRTRQGSRRNSADLDDQRLTAGSYLRAARSLAFAASSSRVFGAPVVSRARKRRADTAAISSTAARNAASLAFDGLPKPLILRTNWSEAACTSSSVTGGSKLNRVLMLLHMVNVLGARPRAVRVIHRRRRHPLVPRRGLP